MRIFHGFFLIWTVSLISNAETKWIPNFFVPEEIQTLLQLVYSRLPPTKIGSDKRFGVGFRLGKNADAQILVELGPQSETQPLADPGNGFSKRQSRQKPPTEYKRSNLISADLKSNRTNNINHKRNHTKPVNEKRAIDTSNTVEERNEINLQKTPEPFDPFRNIIMRWFRWLVQPRSDRIESIFRVKSEKSNNKITKEDNKDEENFIIKSSEGKNYSQIV